MKHLSPFAKLFLLTIPVLALILAAAGCRGGGEEEEVKTTIDELGITTQILPDNSPAQGFSSVILSTTPQIYLSGQINNAVKGVKIGITWKSLVSDRIIASETLSGKNSASQPYDFVIGSVPTTSYFASRILLNDISWPVGDYEVVVESNGQLIKTLSFKIVADDDFDELSKGDLLRGLYLGTEVNDNNQITIPSKRFSRDEENIYAVALLQDVPTSSALKAKWWYVDDNQLITDFSSSFSGSGYLPFKITLDKFSRLWSDNLWPSGNYRVDIYVDNVLIVSKNFTVI